MLWTSPPTERRALSLALEHRYDVVVLDLSLPQLDGLDVCRLIRERSSRYVPILMLTARDSVDDKVLGFELGADDYLTKPFALEELEVRCVALSRRHTLHSERAIELGPLVVDRQRRTVTREGAPIALRNPGLPNHRIPRRELSADCHSIRTSI